MTFCVRTINSRRSLSRVPLVIVLKSQLRSENIAAPLMRSHFHYLFNLVNNKVKAQRGFPKVQRMSK